MIFTQTIFARKLGFKNANDSRFRKLLKKACELKILEVQQSGFQAHSLAHPKIVVQHKSLDLLNFAEEVAETPSSLRGQVVYGYRLALRRTGKRRKLVNGKYSSNEWWSCDCGREIEVGSPYASKTNFEKPRLKREYEEVFNGVRVIRVYKQKQMLSLPLKVKCYPCFLDLVEVFNL